MVVTITPYFWTTNHVWYLDVSVSNARATEGVMGIVRRRTAAPP